MATVADFAMIHGEDLWRRVAHENTALVGDGDVVQLAWEIEELESEPSAMPSPAGLAFDPWCRLYRSIPETGQIQRYLWAAQGSEADTPVDLFTPVDQKVGDFEKVSEQKGALEQPGSLVIDDSGRLYIIESGKQRILIYDLVDKRLRRKVSFEQTLIDLATDGVRVYALLDEMPGIATLDYQTGPHFEKLPEPISKPSRIAITDDKQVFVLNDAGSEGAMIYPVARMDEWLEVPYASDIEFTEEGILVVARLPDQDFLRFQIEPGVQWQLPNLKAFYFDGRGIIRTPDNRIGFWTDKGFAHATLARMRYVKQGRVTSYRLDSGMFQTAWGRVFIDACIPRGTSVRMACIVMDEMPEDVELLERTLPDNSLAVTITRPDLSPPMPAKTIVDKTLVNQKLHKRATGYEFPWLCKAKNDPFETYEAPVIGQKGRYLWLIIELTGTSRTTPKIKSVRAEYPSHDLLRRLPQIYSREEQHANFLRRYLGMSEGILRELDLRSTHRNILLDPDASPEEALPWLAAFMGMVLDDRWSERARREMVRNANWLFRFRGTVSGLKRFIEIYLNFPIEIIEHFKVRGLGGAYVGDGDALTSSAILGAGFRIGGRLDEEKSISINETTILDAFTTHAHRFSVIIPASLNNEQQAVVDHILEIHRPAHTLFDICSVDAGMRAGKSLYAGLTSIVGRGAAFGQLQVNGSLLGRTDLLGIPATGNKIGLSVLGRDSRVG